MILSTKLAFALIWITAALVAAAIALPIAGAFWAFNRLTKSIQNQKSV